MSVRIPALPEGTYDVEVVQGSESSTLRSGLEVRDSGADCRALTVHFELDSSTLTGGDIAALEGNLACYRDSAATLRIEGHCDERGTTDYNLALGDRRARSIERWLLARGIGGNRIATVSYGEERPVDRGHDEAAWSANRRAEIMLVR
ncbi:MAG: OmpA family protein [Alphaproteobacteria bacterium]|nr:OmpA family protein [Alphaproteobacteria bacterium]